jgi:hypothetical protein
MSFSKPFKGSGVQYCESGGSQTEQSLLGDWVILTNDIKYNQPGNMWRMQ